MNRKQFLKNCALIAAGVVAADQIDLLEKVLSKKTYFFPLDRPDLVGGFTSHIRFIYWSKSMDRDSWILNEEDISSARFDPFNRMFRLNNVSIT